MTPFDKKIIEIAWLILISLPWILLIFDIVSTTYKTRKAFLKFSSINFFEWFGFFYAYYLFASVYLLALSLLTLMMGSILALIFATTVTAYIIYRYMFLSPYHGHVLEQRIKSRVSDIFGSK